jgi:hypothetical protein
MDEGAAALHLAEAPGKGRRAGGRGGVRGGQEAAGGEAADAGELQEGAAGDRGRGLGAPGAMR